MYQHHKSTRLITIIFGIALSFSGCGFLNFSSSLLGSNIFGSNGLSDAGGISDTGGNSAGDTVDDLTETEASLFEDGPVDLPVTMAKLDSADTDLIDVTVTETGSAQSISYYLIDGDEDEADEDVEDQEDDGAETEEDVDEDDEVLSDIRYAVAGAVAYDIADGTPVRFDFTFYPGAAPDPTVTPKGFIFNPSTQQQVIIEFEADGSGTAAIIGVMGDEIAVSLMNRDQDRIGPVAFFKPQNNGAPPRIGESNSKVVSISTRTFTDANKNSYFTSKNLNDSPPTYHLWQKPPPGGGNIRLVAYGLPTEPRYVDSKDGDVVSVLTQMGDLYFFVRQGVTIDTSVNADVSIPPPPTVPEGELQPEFGVFSLGNTGDGIVDPIGVPLGRKAFMLDSQRGMLVNVPPVKMDGQPNDYLIRFVPLEVGNGSGYDGMTDLVRLTDAMNAWLAKANNDDYYVFIQPHGQNSFDLFKFSLAGIHSTSDVVNAWNNRTKVIANFTEEVTYITASRSGLVGFSSLSSFDNNPVNNLSFWTWNGTTLTRVIDVTREIRPYSERFNLSWDGDSLVTCSLGQDGAPNQLVRRRLNAGYPANAFVDITNDSGFMNCFNDETTYFVDSSQVLHYMKQEVATGYYQKGKLDLVKFDDWAADQGDALFTQ